jgi:ribosomal protein S18 acetylase RimI-like enzyme
VRDHTDRHRVDADNEDVDVRLRDIRSEDKAALARFHDRLSAETRYRRYHGAKGALTRSELRYLTEVDGRTHVAVVAEDPAGELHGVARAVADGDGAELAIVVADDAQDGGMGKQLVLSLLERCAEAGLRRIVLEVQADNHRALRFFQGLGARQRTAHGGVCTLVLEP